MKIGAVLPLSIRGSYDVDDLGRAELLLKTLDAFGAGDLFYKFLIVCPEQECKTVRERCEKWKSLSIEVYSEDKLVPEFKNHKLRGWRKQQIVKLATPRVLDCDYFVTFDADIICTQYLSKELLFPHGKALLQFEPKIRHPKWWISSALIIGYHNALKDIFDVMSVTPAILASDICKLTWKEIENNLKGKGSWVDRLCSLHVTFSLKNWLTYHKKCSRWTEYSLYYLTMHKYDLVEKYHTKCEHRDVYQKMFEMKTKVFENWNTDYSFSEESEHIFCVVGSKSNIDTKKVANKVEPYLQDKCVCH